VKSFFNKYVEFVRQPDVGRMLLAALASRMPIGMLGFGMLMFLREVLGNFAHAGTIVGIEFIAAAITAPIVGRIVDRYGPRRLLYVTGTVQPAALLAMLIAAKLGQPFAVITTFAVIAGAFSSPITTLTRTMWRHRFDSDDDRRTAFALDSVAIEINFTLGPSIMAAILAAFGATAAFGVVIVTIVLAFFAFMASPALRYFKQAEAGIERHLLGPLTDGRLRLIFIATFGLAMSLGLLEVGYPAYGIAAAVPAMGGLLLGVNSIGSAAGGALYGGLHFRMPVERQFALAVGLMSVGLLLHTLAIPMVAAFFVAAFLAGALIAPSIASQSVLVSRLAPEKYATEAFTWGSMCIVSGIGSGIALGGVLVESVGLPTLFTVSGSIAAATALVALSVRAPIPQGEPAKA
jgi:MFS family permease